jgi:hypothetical protein
LPVFVAVGGGDLEVDIDVGGSLPDEVCSGEVDQQLGGYVDDDVVADAGECPVRCGRPDAAP